MPHGISVAFGSERGCHLALKVSKLRQQKEIRKRLNLRDSGAEDLVLAFQIPVGGVTIPALQWFCKIEQTNEESGVTYLIGFRE